MIYWTRIEQRRDEKLRKTFLCRCVCGVEKVIDAYTLEKGKSKSCGCKRWEGRERPRKYQKGLYGTPEYQAWNHMMQRCYNKNDKHYRDYGGRGITVCQRWRDSYPNFLADMGSRPTPKHSIDRKEGGGNYEPGNCRWATAMEQSQNRRGVHKIEYNGEAHCINEWARRAGLKRTTLAARIFAYGWTVGAAITTPVVRR